MPSGGPEVLILLVLIGLPIVLAVWALSRRRGGDDGAYRALAERVAAADEAGERRLEQIATELAGIRGQLADLQRVLSEVE